MKIDLTPTAVQQAELIAEMEVIKTGFILGNIIGKHVIVDQLFPVNFNEENIAEIYEKMANRVNKKLLGVFFNNIEMFPNDWFLEDVIIKINPPNRGPEFYIYDVDKNFVSLNSGGESQREESYESRLYE